MFRFCTAIVLTTLLGATYAQAEMIGINVLLNQPISDTVLADLSAHGQVLDLIPEINAVTVKARASELSAIQALACVAAANPDVECSLADGGDGLPVPDFTGGANVWNLDAINVTDFSGGRTVAYDGEGVYIAVIDTGLPHNWREYFPEQRIATQFARCLGGGAGEPGTISEQPDKWEGDANGHGTELTSVILGFRYAGPDPSLPTYFNGVAPKATIIPVKIEDNGQGHTFSFSVLARSFVYVTNLKISGALGGAPLVINLSWGGISDAMTRAAIDYAIANGVIVVSVAGNDGEAGMTFPGRYAPVISVAATGWVGHFPTRNPADLQWILNDVPENDVAQHFIAPFSSRELPGQELDLAAPGVAVPAALTINGQVDYTFAFGTSLAAPHVAGVAALMLQKNPSLTQAQVEAILKNTAMPIPPNCRNILWGGERPGNPPTWSDYSVYFFDTNFCWGANATGAGLLQADAALAATPLP